MSKGIIVLIVLAIVIGVFFMQYVGVRNTLADQGPDGEGGVVAGRYRIAAAGRSDPKPCRTVKGIAQQEQTVFGDIAKARAALLSAGAPAEKIAKPATR